MTKLERKQNQINTMDIVLEKQERGKGKNLKISKK